MKVVETPNPTATRHQLVLGDVVRRPLVIVSPTYDGERSRPAAEADTDVYLLVAMRDIRRNEIQHYMLNLRTHALLPYCSSEDDGMWQVATDVSLSVSFGPTTLVTFPPERISRGLPVNQGGQQRDERHE